MALKTIESYNEAKDYTFSPIENADYALDKFKFDGETVCEALDKSVNFLEKFLRKSEEIMGGLNRISNTGISSTQLEDTFARIRNNTKDAIDEVVISNYKYSKTVEDELREIKYQTNMAYEELDSFKSYTQCRDRLSNFGKSYGNNKTSEYFNSNEYKREQTVRAQKENKYKEKHQNTIYNYFSNLK